jgi:hypothetical protein
MMPLSAEKFSTLTTMMKKSSKSTSIICTERVFLYPADQNTKVNGVKWGFRQTRVTNKNLHGLTTKKGSKMTKKRGSKKGQKWPKIGVQKRVKNGPKINFFEDIKTNVDKTKKIRVTTTLKLILISQTYEKQRQLTTKKTQNLSQK